MKHLIPFLTLFFCGATGAWAQSDPGTDVAIPNEPILSGHSHNDYLRRTPLWDALSLGFASIEVDIHLASALNVRSPALDRFSVHWKRSCSRRVASIRGPLVAQILNPSSLVIGKICSAPSGF